MNASNVRVVFRKDWIEIARNWQVLFPVVVVPIVFSLLLPLFISNFPTSSGALGPLQGLLNSLPSDVKQQLASFNQQQTTFYMVSVYFFAPFFLVIPLIASSVIASDSFAGEKERRTIEALLATPISDSEMFLGKMLVAFVAAMLATIGSFLVYASSVDAISAHLFQGRLILPSEAWFVLVFLLAPTVSLASVGLTVTISARVKGFREAQQINAILIVPILILIFSEVWVAVILGPFVIASLAASFGVVDLLMFWAGVRLFRREEILSTLS
jgi:ABC-2 type transport system permease protein